MDSRREQFIAGQFLCEGAVVNVRRLGNGLINDTYLVTTDRPAGARFVLQRINAEVFPFPDRIMANLERLARHLAGRDPSGGSATRERFRLPSLLSTREGKNSYIGESGDFWRAWSYIENGHALERLESPEDAGEVGFALGRFHREVSDLGVEAMLDSLPGFHITPLYVSRYDRIQASVARARLSGSRTDLSYCENFVETRRNRAAVLEDAKAAGRLTPRVIHGDPKLNNILFEKETRKALTMIDLDTVKPGLIHYDIGDCLRSCCNRAGESSACAEAAVFDLETCEAILTRYFQECASLMNRAETDHLYDAIHLLPFELGLRFLTDYLEGNRYFKVAFPEENLARALIQFHLAESVEKQESAIRSLIRRISDPSAPG